VRAGKAIVFGVALFALVAGAGVVALSRVDTQAITGFISEAVRQATGREVVVRGATELRLFPTPTLVAENVVFANAPWSISPDMVRVKRLEARVGVLPLFLGQLRVSRFRLLEPHVLLEKDKKGRRNWDFGSEPGVSGEIELLASMPSGVRMVVSEIQIVDGTFSYREGNITRTIRIPRLSAHGDVGGGPLELAGRGQFQGQAWKLSGSAGELSALLHNQPYDLALVLTSAGTKITAAGAVERPLDGFGLRMDLKLEARSGSRMLAMAGFDLDLPGSVQATAVLTDTADGLRLDKLHAKAAIGGGHISASGSVEDLIGMRGVSLGVGVKSKSLAHLTRLTGVDLPKTGPLKATARISNPKDRYRLDKLSADIALRGATLKLSGKITNLARGRGLSLGIDLQASSLAKLSRYVGAALPAVGPVKVSARLSRTKHGYKLAKLDARAGRSDAAGELYIYPHRKRPRVVGSLAAKYLDLDQLLSGADGRDDKRIFSAEPFPVALLRTFDGEVSVHARKLYTQSMQMDKVKTGMSLGKGRLKFTQTGTLGGGKFNVKLSLDTRGKRPYFTVRVRGKAIGLGKVSEQIYDTKFIDGAAADVNIDVAGRGNSMRELMANLSGGVYVAAGKATIHNKRLQEVSGDVVTEVLSTIAMQSSEEKTTHVRCGIVRVPVKNGLVKVDRTIAMETTRAAFSASGTIDLREEALDLGIDLVGRTGPNLGASSLSGLVRVRGTIAEPVVGANAAGIAAGIAGAAATVAGAVATGGLSLIAQGLISQIVADRSTCKTALEIDNGDQTAKVARNKARSRNGAELEPASPSRERTGGAPAVVADGESGKSTDDGS
jgi:uncharacterized protein involved in outer membrane biogenesis